MLLIRFAIRELYGHKAMAFVEAPCSCVLLEGVQPYGGRHGAEGVRKQLCTDSISDMRRMNKHLFDPRAPTTLRQGDQANNSTFVFCDRDATCGNQSLLDPLTQLAIGVGRRRIGHECGTPKDQDFRDTRRIDCGGGAQKGFHRGLTFDMSGGRKQAKLAGGRPLAAASEKGHCQAARRCRPWRCSRRASERGTRQMHTAEGTRDGRRDTRALPIWRASRRNQ